MLPLLLQTGFFGEQLLFGDSVALFVYEFVQKVPRELAELLFDGLQGFGGLLNALSLGSAFLLRHGINRGMDLPSFVGEERERMQFGDTLRGEAFLAQIRLMTVSRHFAGAAVVAVNAAVAFSPLCRDHRPAGAAEKPAKGEIVAIPDFSWLALYLHHLLDGVEKLHGNNRSEFTFVNFTFPFHETNVEAIRKKLLHLRFRVWGVVFGSDIAFQEPLCARGEPKPPL